MRLLQTKTVKVNQLSNPDYMESDWICPDCLSRGVGQQLDSQIHITTCESYAHFCNNLDLDNDLDMVKYFQLVIAHRQELFG